MYQMTSSLSLIGISVFPLFQDFEIKDLSWTFSSISVMNNTFAQEVE